MPTSINWPGIFELLPDVLDKPNVPCLQIYKYVNNCELKTPAYTELEQELIDDKAACKKHIKPSVIERVLKTEGMQEVFESYETLKAKAYVEATDDGAKRTPICFPSIKNYFRAIYMQITTVEQLNEKVSAASVPEDAHTPDEINLETKAKSPLLTAVTSHQSRKLYNQYAQENLLRMLQINQI